MSKTAEVKEKKKVNQKSVRFSDAAWYNPNLAVIIGGVGSIGSHLSYYLGRQECDMYLYDFDTVEETNQGGQMYNSTAIGKKKTQITKELVAQFSGNNKVTCLEKFKEDSMAGEFMFSCFDNMKARKTFFESWKAIQAKDKVFIDGRMTAEMGQIFIVTPDRIEEYEKELFDDSEVKDAPCTYKATTHCGSLVAALMTAGFNNYIANLKTNKNYREVPFKTEYNLELFKFKIDV